MATCISHNQTLRLGELQDADMGTACSGWLHQLTFSAWRGISAPCSTYGFHPCKGSGRICMDNDTRVHSQGVHQCHSIWHVLDVRRSFGPNSPVPLNSPSLCLSLRVELAACMHCCANVTRAIAAFRLQFVRAAGAASPYSAPIVVDSTQIRLCLSPFAACSCPVLDVCQ